jgi:hypothetical protein
MLLVPSFKIFTTLTASSSIFGVFLKLQDYFFCSTFGEKGKPQSCGSIFTTLHATAGIFDEVFLYFILSLVRKKQKTKHHLLFRFPMVTI